MSVYKIITCPDCGKPFERKAPSQVRCHECQSARRRAIDQERYEAKKAQKKKKDAYVCRRKACKYHTPTGYDYSCNYILVTGHRRGCPVDGCTKYARGKRLSIAEEV